LRVWILALFIRLAAHYIVICGLSGFAVLFHRILQTERLSEKVIESKICVLVSLPLLSLRFSF